jgi:hypothetical protein
MSPPPPPPSPPPPTLPPRSQTIVLALCPMPTSVRRQKLGISASDTKVKIKGIIAF